MAKKKLLGYKTIVRIDGAAVGFLMNVTPSAYSREAVDVTVIDDLIQQTLDADPPKIEPIKLTCFWDPADTGDDAFETIFFDTDPDAREVPIELEFQASNPKKKLAFNGRIMKITPAQVSQKDKIAREIEIQPTSKPTKTTVA